MVNFLSDCASLFSDTLLACLGNEFFGFFFKLMLFLMVFAFLLYMARWLSGANS